MIWPVSKRAKSQLASDVVLAHFDPQQRLAVACDASPYGVGAVLSHLYNDGSERPFANWPNVHTYKEYFCRLETAIYMPCCFRMHCIQI